MEFVDLTSPPPAPAPPSHFGVAPVHIRMDALDDLPVKDFRVSVGKVDNTLSDSVSMKCSLTRSQQSLVDMARSGSSFFFTGCAGTGKTFTMRSIIDALPPSVTFVTALTGIAASLLPGGTTLHSFVGFGHGEGMREQLLKKVKSNRQAVTRWRSAKTLIIDEISMLSEEMFEAIDYIGREIRGKVRMPFGGVQIICSGDFFQLPPVARNAAPKYCFNSPLWAELMGGNSYELTQIFRQKDERLIHLLNDIRYGTMTSQTVETIQSLRREINPPSGIVPTQLVPMNNTADAINIRELERLPELSGNPIFSANDWAVDQFTYEMLPKITLFPDSLFLRVGAQVMLLKNKPDFRLYNGSRGVVVGFRDGKLLDRTAVGYIGSVSIDKYSGFDLLPLVRFGDGQEVVVGPDSFDLEGVGKSAVRARRVQLPLRLSWAITIHKSQGMSLDFLKVDASRSFEAGQAYVALSRARTMEGLQVVSFDPRKCWCDPIVAEFYKTGIQKLSDETNISNTTATKRSAEWIARNPSMSENSPGFVNGPKKGFGHASSV